MSAGRHAAPGRTRGQWAAVALGLTAGAVVVAALASWVDVDAALAVGIGLAQAAWFYISKQQRSAAAAALVGYVCLAFSGAALWAVGGALILLSCLLYVAEVDDVPP